MRARPAVLVSTLVLVSAALGPALSVPLCAQQPAPAFTPSPYVPLQHWVMPYVEHLIARGVMDDPTPLTRPLRRADLLRALGAVDTLTHSAAVVRTVQRLIAALADERDAADAPHYRVTGDVGVAAATYAKRDPLAAIDTSGDSVTHRVAGPGHAIATAGLDLEFLLGPVVAVTHPEIDTRLKYDPDWYGKKDRAIAGRTSRAYVAAQWRLGEVFFGRLDRNWGPSGIQGLLLSDDPYGLDHLGLTFGTARFQLQAIATQLDDRTDSTGALVHRYMVQHRLWTRPARSVAVALWEGAVLSGPGRQLEPWYLNILNAGILEQWNNAGNVNSFVGLDVERHGALTVFAQVMLDDIQIDRKTPADVKPSSYGLTVGAKGGLGFSSLSWTAFYTRVTNLTYRNEDNLQVPLYHFLGTGRNFDDYDQATLAATLLPHAGLLLTPELTYLRQGEGDPREPHPPVAAYPTTATIFQGVVERTLRGALSGSYAPGERLGVTFGAGVHHVTNFQHVAGATRTAFVGSVGAAYRFRFGGELP
jgi:hypothetical protein